MMRQNAARRLPTEDRSSAIDALAETTRRQNAAADPRASVWVSANAGTGKTHVLSNRVLRLLLDGTPPERILCLTYTKAAAAEMSKRVFDKLAEWTKQSDKDLIAALAKLTGTAPADSELALARTLFARAIETPGGLKVQTIHAFCERILKRFPLEAGVPPDFNILDDATAAALLREATDDMLGRAAAQRQSPLGRALTATIAHASEHHFDEVLKSAIASRSWLAWLAGFADDGGDPIAEAEPLYRAHFGLAADATEQTIATRMANVLSEADLRFAIDALSAGKTTDIKLADALRIARDAGSVRARIDALGEAFLTQDGEPRKDGRFITKDVRGREPTLFALLARARDAFAALGEERQALRVVEATMALARLALDVMDGYGAAKARRAALDFDDLILRTEKLLSAPGSSEWVLFKLDGGLTHVLVDESQDTSPTQWRIVAALAEGFFAAAGSDVKPRTLFAVGDEKQSIYSFQGAAPELFALKGAEFRRRAEEAGQRWQALPLTLSFRTTEPVLDAVDRVFADPGRTPGVGSGIAHQAIRAGQAGVVELWDTEKPEAVELTDAFEPLAEAAGRSSPERLAARIADTIQGWLARGERLASENRPVRAGDILILVRKRAPFAKPMVAALKARRIPVAGADRMLLTDQIAVADLITLGDFLTLPEDDLALATILKSPLFGLDDDDLMRIACGRKRTLWKALMDAAVADARYVEAVETLRRWRKAADFDPPFEFLANLLDRDGMRKRFIARLGDECAEGLDELLSLAIAYDEAAPPSLPGFLAWLREAERVVKRDMEHGRDEVRVMTAHGAKGLEAPIVFLPDTCSTGSGARPGTLRALPGLRSADGAMCWPVRGTGGLPQLQQARADAEAADSQERNRLLYVAMTRARDRLYVAGFETKKRPRPDCWYRLIEAGLADVVEEQADAAGQRVRRLAAAQTAPHERQKAEALAQTPPLPLPHWGARHAPAEPRLAVPLAPSRLAPYDVDAEGEPAPLPPAAVAARSLRDEPPTRAAVTATSQTMPAAAGGEGGARAAAAGSDIRFLRGTLTHALLEHLPTLPRDRWQAAAEAFVARRGGPLADKARAGIVAETLAIMTDPAFAPLFAERSRPEVPIVAELKRPVGRRGPPVRLNGQIDRLVVGDETVMIVDYKSNRAPPNGLEGVAPAYLFQLAAYRMALRLIYPGKAVEAALLWTEGPQMMPIPRELLDAYEGKLWDIDTADAT